MHEALLLAGRDLVVMACTIPRKMTRGDVSYFLSCFDAVGRRLPREPLVADSDDAAIALMQLGLHTRCELWKNDRLIFRLPNKPV